MKDNAKDTPYVASLSFYFVLFLSPTSSHNIIMLLPSWQ
jgi:hypothetical protein